MNPIKATLVLAVSVGLAATLAAAPQSKAAPSSKAPSVSAQKAPVGKAGKAKAGTLKKEDLPQAVQAAVMKAHPNGTIVSAAKSMRGGDTVYAVHVSDAGKTTTMMLKEDGTMPAAAKKSKAK